MNHLNGRLGSISLISGSISIILPLVFAIIGLFNLAGPDGGEVIPFFFLGIVLGILAIITGVKAKKESHGKVGLILGIAGSVISLIVAFGPSFLFLMFGSGH